MKLSSISLIAAALAAIAGSTTAAPTPRPFERDVYIYNRQDRRPDGPSYTTAGLEQLLAAHKDGEKIATGKAVPSKQAIEAQMGEINDI